MSKSLIINRPRTLHFDVTSGLKSVLGSDLITDDEVAIFELVKNSFDAEAKLVQIYFDTNQIVIADNGIGMDYEDLTSKWLKVAYSTKKENNDDFRNDITNHKYYAGSKGIGRFSSDRLGEFIHLQTRPKGKSKGPIHSVKINWNDFDKDLKERFEKIKLGYSETTGQFELPPQVSTISYGTVISIQPTRLAWNREKILRLKASLAKLINPFGSIADGFVIKLVVPKELNEDNRILAANKRTGEETPPNTVVNGEIGNFIFSTLQEKTTFINVKIDTTGKYLETKLIDRGELIYHIQEPNEFNLLKSANFNCQIFFLNFSAKLTFARRMGVPSVQFGSVFLFRNGFRVFPIGEEGDDWFGMDRRKQQGYARFLGTRDVIGRIDVSGSNNQFEEASSRNTGLKENEAVAQLRECFEEYCLKRLEKYVVPVTFPDKEDKNTSDVSRLLTDSGKARVAAAVAKLVDDKNIKLLNYSQRLISLLSERSSQFESSLTNFRAIAEKTKDKNLFSAIEGAEKRFQELKLSEERARLQADAERKAKEEAEERAAEAIRQAAQANEQFVEEKKRNHFLTSIANLDTETILNLHHQVTIYSVDLQQQIENFILQITAKKQVSTEDVLNVLESIAFLNSKIMGVSKFATKANFRLESEKIEADVAEYVEEYINGVAKDFLSGNMTVSVENDGKGFIQKFKPIDISIVIENLIRNAGKARATKVDFVISHPQKNILNIEVTDNGRGFDKKIADLDRVFEKGFTTTDGSGLGLFHVRQVLGEMKGTIEASKPPKSGARFLIKIAK